MSEELVFLLRACGQYTVGAGEHEAGLASALLSAQAGASTKLRAAGFRQKVKPRLAIGLARLYWETQEKFSLSAPDFLPCAEAEGPVCRGVSNREGGKRSETCQP